MSTQGKGEKNITRAEKRMAINKQKKIIISRGGGGRDGRDKEPKKIQNGAEWGGGGGDHQPMNESVFSAL